MPSNGPSRSPASTALATLPTPDCSGSNSPGRRPARKPAPVKPAAPQPAQVKPARRASAPRRQGSKPGPSGDEKRAALLAAWERLRSELGTDRPPVRALGDAAGVGKSLAARWLAGHLKDMDNGQEAAA